MAGITARISAGFNRRVRHAAQNRRLAKMALQVEDQAHTAFRPVVFFNASTRLNGMSLNAGFSLIASWALKLNGVPVTHFVCNRGMSRCVLGTDRNDLNKQPPCQECAAQSKIMFSSGDAHWFSHQTDPSLACLIEDLPLDGLEKFVFQGMPLGKIVLPSIRWILRRHHLSDDEGTRFLYRQYLLSAWGIATQFKTLLDEVLPQAVVVFNGMFFPEATARWVAQNQAPAVKVITHEVGLQPFSCFFTTGEATAYPIDIPDTFELDERQAEQLDQYLTQRFKGNFSMAGIRFWPDMQPISDAFWEKASNFKQIVPVFTNVIFDTSQDHANVVFEHMFEWLDLVHETIKAHPETLFVIRAHPDETRPGKQSLESVADWVQQNYVDQLPNVHFVPSDQYFSSYELIERSKFVLIYNSTIGLEASIMGVPVLCSGKARFTQIPTVFFPGSIAEYQMKLNEFLLAEKIAVPELFQRNARRFLYYQIFRSSLSFDKFLEEDGVWKGYAAVKPFAPDALKADRSESVRVLLEGILDDGSFLLDT